jgi:hypothetical protein
MVVTQRRVQLLPVVDTCCEEGEVHDRNSEYHEIGKG